MDEEEKSYLTLDDLDAAETLTGEEILHAMQGGKDVKVTTEQIKKLIGGVEIIEATCNTEAAVQNKVVTVEGYELKAKDIIAVTFSNENSYGDTTVEAPTYPNLVINNTTLKVCDSRGNSAGKGCWKAGDRIEFRVNVSKTEVYILSHDVRQSSDGVTITSDGSRYYDKQSVDSKISGLIKTKTFRVYFSQATWTASARGMFYATYNFADFDVSGEILSVDISDFYALRTTDIVQALLQNNTKMGIMSNVNSFVSDNAGLMVKVAYI